jgi:hypothetical protein
MAVLKRRRAAIVTSGCVLLVLAIHRRTQEMNLSTLIQTTATTNGPPQHVALRVPSTMIKNVTPKLTPTETKSGKADHSSAQSIRPPSALSSHQQSTSYSTSKGASTSTTTDLGNETSTRVERPAAPAETGLVQPTSTVTHCQGYLQPPKQVLDTGNESTMEAGKIWFGVGLACLESSHLIRAAQGALRAKSISLDVVGSTCMQ